MCDTCDPRVTKLRDLAAQFRDMAEVCDPLFAARLSRTAEELSAMATSLCGNCAPLDVTWAEADPDAELPAADRLVLA